MGDKDPVYTVPDPHGHDINLNSFKMSVALNLLNSADISAYTPNHVNDDEYTRPARVAKHSQDELTRPPRSTG